MAWSWLARSRLGLSSLLDQSLGQPRLQLMIVEPSPAAGRICRRPVLPQCDTQITETVTNASAPLGRHIFRGPVRDAILKSMESTASYRL
jgi:hypothetical protein